MGKPGFIPDSENPSRTGTRTEIQRQFWRESEQRWIPEVNIRRTEVGTPMRWRSRTVHITTTIEPWVEES